MKVIKKTDDYTVYQKRSGRYAVKGTDKKWVNAEDKVKILLAEGLIKVAAPAEPEPEAVEEVAEEATAEEIVEEAAEEVPSAEEEPKA
ncbi:MAG: hypothetical protein R3E73_13540 [Porticoccaceae bacterium]|nr:hypothetical protein [Pseudomonadales bacterium]MCP5173281.1 hypothetical protein [Pseudomonadales bacterium]